MTLDDEGPIYSVFIMHDPPELDPWTEQVRDHVTATEAVYAAEHYTRCISAQQGWLAWVRIVDPMDQCCFEWRRGQGVTFPPLH